SKRSMMRMSRLNDQIQEIQKRYANNQAKMSEEMQKLYAEEGVNPITGEKWHGMYHPIGVNIDSHPSALPHWGVSSADIIYEMPIQKDGSTRSYALFMGEIPAYAGPVRSGRVPMGSLRELWGGAWVFYGWQTWHAANNTVVDVEDWALSLHKDARQKGRWVFPFIEGTERNYANLFHRVKDRQHVAPHNVQIDMKAVEKLFTSEPLMHPFLFTKDGLDRGDNVSEITINYKTTRPAYISHYKYNKATGLYDRYRNGEAYYDALNGMDTSFANVIVLRTDVSWYNGAAQRPVIQLVGQGTAEIFQNGKYIRGTWVRSHAVKADEVKSLPARMVFLDENGDEIPMKVGKTFVQIVNNDQPVDVVSDVLLDGATPKTSPTPAPTKKPTPPPRPVRTRRPNNATPTPGITSAPVQETEEESDNDFNYGN
ncbi:MAG: DUF3048 C-terminal domain-containing protein, partial [Clostridia bacterium]|nr:DUF3048 C-terminal domain-containing protein [Clostridia bacterium]